MQTHIAVEILVRGNIAREYFINCLSALFLLLFFSPDIFLEASESALIASPGYPYHHDYSVDKALWFVIGRLNTKIMVHVEAWLINSNLYIGSDYMITFSHRYTTIFDSMEIKWPSNTLTLIYEITKPDHIGFIAHVTSVTGKIHY